MFRLLQLLQEAPEFHLPQGKVLRLGVLVWRSPGHPPDVLRLVQGVGGEGPQLLLAGGGDKGDPGKVFLHFRKTLLFPAAEAVPPKEEVEDTAKNRGNKDRDDPGDFIGGVAAVVDDVQDHRQAYRYADPVKIDEVVFKPEQQHQEDDHLDQKRHSGKDEAVEQEPE